MRIPNRHIMYRRYQDGEITEAEYKTYLAEQEERERQTSERFERTVEKLSIKERKTHMKQTVKINKIKENAVLPTYGSDKAAGADLYACINHQITIKPHTTEKIGTGLAMELPEGYFGAIFARSGLATKQGLRPANCVGVCDEDYRGEYIVALHNDTDEEKVIRHGDRIAQLVLLPYIQCNFVEDKLSETERGTGGFGSTGK